MATKLVDLSQELWAPAIMFPQYAAPAQLGGHMGFGGIRSTSWRDQNHPGWYDMGGGMPPMGGFDIPSWGHLHGATHLDAPLYVNPEGISADRIPLEDLYNTGVVLDFRHKKKWEPITADELAKATPKIEAGDWVVVNTGWQKQLRPDFHYDYFFAYPGLLLEASEWLIEKKVKGIAGTWPCTDHSLTAVPIKEWAPWIYEDYLREKKTEPEKDFPCPGIEAGLTKLLNAGIICIQNVGGDVDDVTGKRCTLCAWPPRLEHTDANHIRLVAIVE
jgi:kynurenine formamidase